MPVFFTVTGLLALVVPTVCDANVKLDGVGRNYDGATVPVPDQAYGLRRVRCWSVIEMLPESGPATVGVKVTLTVQLAPASNRLPQLFT